MFIVTGLHKLSASKDKGISSRRKSCYLSDLPHLYVWGVASLTQLKQPVDHIPNQFAGKHTFHRQCSFPWKQDLMIIVEKSLRDYSRDGETEAQRGKTKCPITQLGGRAEAASSFQAPPGLSLWNLLGRREVK